MIRIYGLSASGNCHKLRMLLEHLGRPYQWIEIDSFAGQTRTPEFLALNPNGRIPVLQLQDGRCLAESDAILHWLAEGTRYLPTDPWLHAQALSWMFFEQYSHEPYLAVVHSIRGMMAADSPRRMELPRLLERGRQSLAVMERHLGDAAWFSGPDYGVADIALYPNTSLAPRCGFDLAPYPKLRDWMARIEAQPGFVALPPATPEVAARLALPV
ncbi:glutathione S-transferase family protein [Cognatiluteimonas weifangensis]|uniref:Glutathione S-transferase family protein n=1 Tax=Cognatiluteimonas weifangensis TaxID=2303539 RepID=A0A372DPC3_9GAMM|nr:glutathione S-transferase family protein [Luteimonas weifangensis]RFP61287.1 glutathione S-transferase family protein [Luteimonas weifangensis]